MKSTVARCAAAIRTELKNVFPTVKFSVTSESFAGGNAVDIRYLDGPKYDTVRAIVSKYQYGTFDGMTDSYDMDNRNEEIPQAKYVQIERRASEETRQQIAKEYNIDLTDSCAKVGDEWADTFIWRTFSAIDYTAPKPAETLETEPTEPTDNPGGGNTPEDETLPTFADFFWNTVKMLDGNCRIETNFENKTVELLPVSKETQVGEIDLHSYDKFLVMFSGGKDSTALVLLLLDLGVPRERIELWHHDIDGKGRTFMDWESTPGYCRAFADAFGLPIFFSWKDGGFEREMNRQDSLTAPTYFECPTEIPGMVITRKVGGIRGKLSTRRKFPQVSPDLSVRWCSAYLKIDVGSAAIRNQERFNNSRTLVLSGERGQESPARAKYEIFETDRADARDGRSRRHVDRWRPIRDWTEREVWAAIERHRVRVHPAYYLGWGRVSCKFCIFGNANQFASAFAVSPDQGAVLVQYEQEFGSTIKRNGSLAELVAKGTPYDMQREMVDLALSENYTESIFIDNWTLPAGAYGESCGPV